MPENTQQPTPAPETRALPIRAKHESKGEVTEISRVIKPGKNSGQFPPMQTVMDLYLIALGLEPREILRRSRSETTGELRPPSEYRTGSWEWRKEDSNAPLPDDGSDVTQHLHPNDSLVIRAPNQVAGDRGARGGQ